MTTAVTTRMPLPGVPLPDRPAGARPDPLLWPGTLLLAGVRPGQPTSAAGHLAQWGAQPLPDLAGLVAAARSVQLVGAGGAAFPTDRKLASMHGRRVGSVVVNGSEGEASSGKDAALLGHVPHLVLDGARAAATALGTSLVSVRVTEDRPSVITTVARAIRERNDGLRYELSVGPARFVAGEATAVIRALHGEPALPGDLGLPPKAPRQGLRPGRHVFLSNAETFARLAVASRGDRRRSALVSVSGAVAQPGVVEVATEVTLGALAQAVGLAGSPRFLVTGGWHGAWVPWPRSSGARLTPQGLTAVGGRWGAGALLWLPDDVDPRVALAAIARQLAAETAGQCGPCVAGLPALADALQRATSQPGPTPEVTRLLADVDGRGLCAHPTATAAAIRSAWRAIQSGGTS